MLEWPVSLIIGFFGGWFIGFLYSVVLCALLAIHIFSTYKIGTYTQIWLRLMEEIAKSFCFAGAIVGALCGGSTNAYDRTLAISILLFVITFCALTVLTTITNKFMASKPGLVVIGVSLFLFSSIPFLIMAFLWI